VKAGKFDELYTKLVADYPDHLPLLMAKLKHLDEDKKRDEMLSKVIEAADAVIQKIDRDELALHFGRKSDSDDPAAVKVRTEMKDKKQFLIDALARRALAHIDSSLKDDDDDGVNVAKFRDTLTNLKDWIDIDGNDKYATLVLRRDELGGRYGMMLKLLNKLLTGKEVKDAVQPLSRSDLYKKRVEVLKKLGYDALVEYDTRNRIVSSPKAWMLF